MTEESVCISSLTSASQLHHQFVSDLQFANGPFFSFPVSSLRMPVLRLESGAGPMRNSRDGTSIV